MLAIPALGFVASYGVAYYGLDQIRGGNDGFLDLIVPGKYKKVPTDAQVTKATGRPSSPGLVSRFSTYLQNTNPLNIPQDVLGIFGIHLPKVP